MGNKKYMYLVLSYDGYVSAMSIWENEEDALKERERLIDVKRKYKRVRDNEWEQYHKNDYIVVKREINISQDDTYCFEENELN